MSNKVWLKILIRSGVLNIRVFGYGFIFKNSERIVMTFFDKKKCKFFGKYCFRWLIANHE